jgi:two-component system, cell cycle response regulator
MASELVRILLVNRHPDDLDRLQAILTEIREFQAAVSCETTYQATLELLKHETRDVILVNDASSAGMELAREVQTRGYLMPIIILTQQEGAEGDPMAKDFGAVDYLEKDQLNAPLLARAIRYAMQRARMLIEMRELTIHDDLTGLYNRKEFYRMLAEEVNRCLRYNHTMALLMCDLDRFKAINDKSGHLAGDEVLRHLAQALRNVLRSVDRPARYGGDEFAVILPETSAKAARLVAERLCHEVPPLVEAKVTAVGVVLPGSLTLSVGMADLPGVADKAHTLIESVNQALYTAKCRGGNSVVYALGSSRLR